MFKLALVIFIAMLSKGYFQEWNGLNNFLPTGRSVGRPLDIKYGEQTQHSKPCPHRRANGEIQEWNPIYTSGSKMLKPGDKNLILEPQQAIIPDVRAPYALLTGSPSNTADIVPNIRPNSFETPINNDVSFRGYDCDTDLDRQDLDSPIQNQEISGNYKTAKECLNRKNMNISDERNPHTEVLILNGRRFSGDSDTGNKNGSELKHEEEDEQHLFDTDVNPVPTKHMNDGESSSGRVPDNIHKVAVPLRPGKLLNSLQNPTISLAISHEYASSRRTAPAPAESSRVCYACSSATNPSCWEPDNRTTVKYCREEHNCVTKTFGVKNWVTVIRDCAAAGSALCEASSAVDGIQPMYNTCSVCDADLCNSAGAGALTNTHNIIIIFIITAYKCIV